MKAVSSRISGGSGPKRWPIRCWCSTSTSKLPTITMLAVGADALLAAAELAGLHVALHDVHAVLLVEGDAGHLVEADHVVLADQAALAGGHVHEHLRDGRLAARDQVRVRRDLLVEMALAGALGAQLDHVVVALHERHHAQETARPSAARSGRRLQTRCDRIRRVFHSSVVKPGRAALRMSRTSRLGELDRPQ